MKINQFATVLATGLLVVASASAQRGTTGTSDKMSSDKMSGGKMRTDMRSSVSAADKKFIMMAAEGGMKEVEAGKVAASKASSDSVKQLAQKIVDAHTKANEELKTIAEGKGVTLPTSLNAKDQAMMTKMNAMSGEQFDKAYLLDQSKDHHKTIALFQKEISSGADADVKAFAQKTLPEIENHTKMIDDAKGGKMSADHKM